jgi:tRNA A37 threonylcarbamoyladenosine synthetase subunit TsaC/SUA5/YrdC
MEYENQETAISSNYEKTMDFFLKKEQMGLIPSTVYNCTSGVLELIREGKGELL